MREQLKKEVARRCGTYVQSSDAAAVYEKSIEEITAKYDRLVGDGQAELDVYKAMLSDVEAMKLMLAAMPVSQEEQTRQKNAEKTKKRKRKLNHMIGDLHGIHWLLTVILYFVISFLFGNWHLTWLLFLSGAIGSMILEMVKGYNNGTPIHKTGKWHGILWVTLVMVYFLVSFLTGGWSLTWLIFPGGALLEILWDIIRKWSD